MPSVYLPDLEPGRVLGEYAQILVAGCAAHPEVELVEHPADADLVFLDFRHLKPRIDVVDRCAERAVLVDYADGQTLWRNTNHVRHYFKRSMVRYSETAVPLLVSYSREVHPIAYPLRDDFLRHARPPETSDRRPIDVSCFFEPVADRFLRRGSVAERILRPSPRWRYAAAGLRREVGIVGSRGEDGRSQFQPEYFERMRQSRVVVTCNPVPRWEGDYRLFEALASGAMVMVNRMLTPVHHPFAAGRHLVFYDDLDDLERKLYRLLGREDERLEIARQGFAHALAHHKVVDRIDEILRVVMS